MPPPMLPVAPHGSTPRSLPCSSMRIAVLLFCLCAPAGARSAPIPTDVRLYFNYAAKPDSAAVLAHDLCILDPGAEAPLDQGRTMGHTQLAYISTVEVVPGTAAAKSAQKRRIPVKDKNAGW